MVPIPIPVTDVTITLYTNPLSGPVMAPSLTGAHGTYSVGTLINEVFYNLNITGGTHGVNPLTVGSKYVANYKTEDGQIGHTPWMTCMQVGENIIFGRTEIIGASNNQGDVHIHVHR